MIPTGPHGVCSMCHKPGTLCVYRPVMSSSASKQCGLVLCIRCAEILSLKRWFAC